MSIISEKTARKLFITTAIVGIAGWFFIFGLFLFWYLMPSRLPTVTQPMPILNENSRIAVGDPIVVQFDVNKEVNRDVESSSRYITCESGNLVTLTAASTTLPIGSYNIVSDSVLLPNKVTVGDVCALNLDVNYQINPLKEDTLRLKSEKFVVSE